MSQKWYQKAGVQAALVVGVLGIVGTIVAGVFVFSNAPTAPDNRPQTVVEGDIHSTATNGGQSVVVIGNGTQMAAVTTRREIADKFTDRLHFNTYGGNPLSMAVGLAVMDVIEEDGLQENARVVGERLKHGLEGLQQKHEAVGDVRGHDRCFPPEAERWLLVKEEDDAALGAVRQRGHLLGRDEHQASLLLLELIRDPELKRLALDRHSDGPQLVEFVRLVRRAACHEKEGHEAE